MLSQNACHSDTVERDRANWALKRGNPITEFVIDDNKVRPFKVGEFNLFRR